MRRSTWQDRIADAAALRKERTKRLLAQMKERRVADAAVQPSAVPQGTAPSALAVTTVVDDRDLGVVPETPNQDLVQFIDLIDRVHASDRKLHVALFWPHISPRAILPWMLREVSRGRTSAPLRTLFVNMGRPALRTIAGIVARTERLRTRGLVRSGAIDGALPSSLGPDAQFYMFLGDKTYGGIPYVPFVSIVPHSVALNDGTFWRDFDEKTLKGFKRLYPPARLNSIRGSLEILSSARAESAADAFVVASLLLALEGLSSALARERFDQWQVHGYKRGEGR